MVFSPWFSSLSDSLDLSNDAKVLYALLLDQAGISKKKGYIEADGIIRLYFTYVGQIHIPLKIRRESLNESEPA